MRVLLSLNEDFSRYLKGDKTVPSYDSSRSLYKEFEKRGHDVYLVHPTQIFGNDKKYFENLFRIDGSKLESVKKNWKVDGDVFFVRSLGEDASEDKSLEFMSGLYDIEKQVGIMLNDAKSTSYEYKPKQKSLDLPFIPGFDVRNEYDLETLLVQGKQIIAKPNIGFYGMGIIYLENMNNVDLIPNESIAKYSYELFMPEKIEKRYIFLDGEIIVKRIMEKFGEPGKEKFGRRYFNTSPDKLEMDIVHEAMDMTGMFYGCVDFRQGHILEINGSGTGTTSENGDYIFYDINSEIVDKVEEKFNKK